ncbi:hypothetical protein I3842_03G230800 [Carya illinoinensis]|uniref:Uncharacterized protein n=1 Tax=Carya illinoinensis TaxID=32201 RepID=A0A922FNZ8_CARIL|nr:hypothetical protein I3842_03G230800 [Carya illinoinensis]
MATDNGENNSEEQGDVGYDEERLSLIRRIDFALLVEKDDKKKQKNISKESSTLWQQKPLPNETLSGLSVSAATKLQFFCHLGKYFNQSAKALEQQVAREARFYGALISKTGKLKASEGASAPGSEGFTIDLFDNSLYYPAAVFRPSSLSTVHVDHDSAGMLSVFDLVNREAIKPSLGVNVTGIRENYIQLSIGNQTAESLGSQNLENVILLLDSLDGVKLPEEEDDCNRIRKMWGFPNRISYAIYLQQIFNEHDCIYTRVSGQGAKDGSGLLGHFSICRVPYPQLISHPTWHSPWTLFMKVPLSSLHAFCQAHTSNNHCAKSVIKSQFRTKVLVNDDCISVEGEGAPNVVSLFRGNSEEVFTMNRYDCDLADLPAIILQQIFLFVAGQVFGWLHTEALSVGIKVKRDFLCLCLKLEQGKQLGRCTEEQKLHMDISDGASEYRKFLGHLSLDVLYSTLMD